MTQQLDPRLRRLIAELPAHKRQAATTFFSDAHGFVSPVLNPLLPPTPSYKNLAHFYLVRGRPFSREPLTGREISIITRLASHNLSFYQPGACFRNASLIAHEVPGLRYAEGIGHQHGSVVLHAWLALGNKAIDPTWPIEVSDRPSRRFDRMLQRIDFNLRHSRYWGVTIPQERVNQVICATRFYCPILTDGVGLRPRLRRAPKSPVLSGGRS